MHYTADRAFRQYDATDPANRLVAAELELRWNRALTRVSEMEARIAAHDRVAPPRSELSAVSFVILADDLIANDELIAGILNRNKLTMGRGNRWTRERVTALRSHHKIPVRGQRKDAGREGKIENGADEYRPPTYAISQPSSNGRTEDAPIPEDRRMIADRPKLSCHGPTMKASTKPIRK
jgi:hypothetical protein